MASKSLGTLTIDLIAKTGGFEQGMSRAERSAERGSREIERRLQRVDKAFDRIRIGVATAGVAIAGAVGAWVNNMTKSMDATLKMAQQIGTTTEALTGLRYAAQQFSNVSDSTFDMSLRRMTRRIAEAAEGSGAAKKALEGLGVSAKELAGLSVEEQFYRVADAIKGASDQGSRLRATMAIFDTEGMPLVSALSEGREEIQKFVKEAERLGVVIDTKAAEAAARFQSNLDRMSASLRGVGIQIGNQVFPVLADFVDELERAARETGGVLDEARKLSSDTSLPEWIEAGAIGLARFLDVAVGVAKALSALSGSVRSVVADIELFAARMAIDNTGIAALFNPEEAERRNQEYQHILESRNKIVEDANQAYIDLWNYQGNAAEQAMQKAFDKQRFAAGFVGPMPRPEQLPAIGVSPSGGGRTTKNQASELQNLINQLDQQRATLGMTETQAGRYRIETAKGAETDRARALALYDQIQAWKEAKTAIDQAAESSRYIAAINRELEVFQQQQDIEIAGIGMGDRQREEMERELAVRQEYAERRRQLEEAQQVESTRLSQEQYEARIAALQDAEERQIGILQDGAMRKREAESSWLNGMNRSLQNYVDNVSNVSQQVDDLFTNAFRNAEDALVNFIMTGELDLENLVRGIGEELIRMLVRMGLQMAANAILGQTMATASTAMAVATGTAMAAAYAPAAALASLASFGANAAPATAGLVSTVGIAQGLAFAGLFDEGGVIPAGKWGIAGELGPEIIEGPARVTSRVDTANLLSRPQGGLTVNLIENPDRAGQVDRRTTEDGDEEADIFVADIFGDGRRSRAMQQAFGLRRVGR